MNGLLLNSKPLGEVYWFRLSGKVAVIGAGKIGEAIIKGLIAKGFRDLVATCRSERRRKQLSYLGIPIILNNREAVAKSNIIIISVKPHQVRGVLKEVRDLLNNKLLISVAASITTKFIEGLVRGVRVIRAMPNINALVGESITAISPGSTAKEEDVKLAMEIFGSIGECVVVEEELMDAITAYSGSGPAYVLAFLESLVYAGLRIGIPRDKALELAIRTLIGTSRLISETKVHPAQLRELVITPGGVTIEALYALERNGFKATIMDAVYEAYKRAKELSERLNK